jgi:hypothetical protein
MSEQVTTLPDARYEEVPFPDGGIAFEIDRDRAIIRIVRRRVPYYFDLAKSLQGMDKSGELCYDGKRS